MVTQTSLPFERAYFSGGERIVSGDGLYES